MTEKQGEKLSPIQVRMTRQDQVQWAMVGRSRFAKIQTSYQDTVEALAERVGGYAWIQFQPDVKHHYSCNKRKHYYAEVIGANAEQGVVTVRIQSEIKLEEIRAEMASRPGTPRQARLIKATAEQGV
jgi:hypothetical protein